MRFYPGKKSYIALFLISGLLSFLGLLYAQTPASTLYYWYVRWDSYYNLTREVFSYHMPLVARHYITQPGDSFWSIAKRFNLNIDTIVSFNDVPKVHVIPSRLRILIPFRDGIKVTRREDQSLEELEVNYNVEGQDILFFNPDFYSTTNVFLPGALYRLEVRMGKLGSEFLKPLKEVYITSLFGLRIHPITKKRQFHYGVDIRGRPGETIYSAKGGRVIFSGEATGFGILVVISHSKGYVSKYAHMARSFVKPGVIISSQHPIGTIGNTGMSTGYHLHFEIWKNGKPIDPRDVTDFY